MKYAYTFCSRCKDRTCHYGINNEFENCIRCVRLKSDDEVADMLIQTILCAEPSPGVSKKIIEFLSALMVQEAERKRSLEAMNYHTVTSQN